MLKNVQAMRRAHLIDGVVPSQPTPLLLPSPLALIVFVSFCWQVRMLEDCMRLQLSSSLPPIKDNSELSVGVDLLQQEYPHPKHPAWTMMTVCSRSVSTTPFCQHRSVYTLAPAH